MVVNGKELNLQIVSKSVACADLRAHNMEVFCTHVQKNLNFSVEVPVDDAVGGAASLSLEERWGLCARCGPQLPCQGWWGSELP